MSAFLAKWWTPKRKAWVAGVLAAAGAQLEQFLAGNQQFDFGQLARSIGLGVLTFIGTHTVKNDPPS